MSPNVNLETSIPYGVIHGNSVPHLLNEIISNGVNETWTSFKQDRADELSSFLHGWIEYGLSDDPEELALNLIDDTYWDGYESTGEDEYSYTDSDGNEFLLGSLGGAPLIWCIKTNVIVHARECSICVPGAGDLDNLNEDGMECYGVPQEYIEEE